MISEVMSVLDETMFITGIVMIIDLEGFTLSHLMHRPLAIIKKHMRFNIVSVNLNQQFISAVQIPHVILFRLGCLTCPPEECQFHSNAPFLQCYV